MSEERFEVGDEIISPGETVRKGIVLTAEHSIDRYDVLLDDGVVFEMNRVCKETFWHRTGYNFSEFHSIMNRLND